MANQNLLAGLAGFAQGFAPAFSQAKMLQMQMEKEKQARQMKRLDDLLPLLKNSYSSVGDVMNAGQSASRDWSERAPDVAAIEAYQSSPTRPWSEEEMQSLKSVTGQKEITPTDLAGKGIPGFMGQDKGMRGEYLYENAQRREAKRGTSGTFQEHPAYKLGRSYITSVKGGDPLKIDQMIASMSPAERKAMKARIMPGYNNLLKKNGIDVSLQELDEWLDILLPATSMSTGK